MQMWYSLERVKPRKVNIPVWKELVAHVLFRGRAPSSFATRSMCVMNTTRPWSLVTLSPPRLLLPKELCCRGRTPRLRKWSSGREIQPHNLLINFKKLLNSLLLESLSRMMIEMRIRKIRERTLSLFSRRLLRRRLSKIPRLSEGVEKAHWSSHTFTLRMDLYDFHQQGVSRHFDYTIIYLCVYYVVSC